jgi:hypothetical protein
MPENDIVAIEVAKTLKIKPADLERFVMVKEDDQLRKGTILATKKSFLGVEKMKVYSPVEGVVRGLDTLEGVILVELKEFGETQVVVKKAKKARKKLDKKVKGLIEGLLGFGKGKGAGWLLESEVSHRVIIPEMEGKILVMKTVPEATLLYKAAACGVEGVVALASDEEKAEDLKESLEEKMRMGFVLIPENTKISRWHNKMLEIDGHKLVVRS